MAKIVSEVHHYMAHFFSQTDKDVTKKNANPKIGLFDFAVCLPSSIVAAPHKHHQLFA